MSLWTIFYPGYLIDIFGLQFLPIIAISLYLYVFFAFIKNPDQRLSLFVFLFLTAIAAFINANGVRPNNDDIIKPLSLLAVMIMPVLILVIQLSKKCYQLVFMWGLVTFAGWALSFAWVLWMYAMSRS